MFVLIVFFLLYNLQLLDLVANIIYPTSFCAGGVERGEKKERTSCEKSAQQQLPPLSQHISAVYRMYDPLQLYLNKIFSCEYSSANT